MNYKNPFYEKHEAKFFCNDLKRLINMARLKISRIDKYTISSFDYSNDLCKNKLRIV